ncbi:MAG: response regulator [Planctomycetota bacterium]
MSPEPKSSPRSAAAVKARRRTCRTLLVQPQPALRGAVQACATPQRLFDILHAPTLADARQHLARQPIDLAIIQTQLPDGSGLDLTAEISRLSHTTATIVVADTADFDVAQAALRAGADDLIASPLAPRDLAPRVAHALNRKTRDKAHTQRIERLHRLCKKLNAARLEVSQQVDLLCNDLVTAYQELACQMQNVVQTSEYAELVQNQLDLETLLRATLEHLMAKLGSANAAIFLPATMDEYSLGGYVNYDRSPESAELILQQLGDHLAPRIAAVDDLVHLTEPQDLEEALGYDAGLLRDSALLAVPCMSEDECLAVLVLFREADQPFEEEHLDRVSALAPMLGDALEKIIRIHHRSVFAADPGSEFDDVPDYEDDADESGDNPTLPF